MWKEGDKIIFSECLLCFPGQCPVRKTEGANGKTSSPRTATKVKERQTTVLAAAAATLVNPGTPLKAKL